MRNRYCRLLCRVRQHAGQCMVSTKIRNPACAELFDKAVIDAAGQSVKSRAQTGFHLQLVCDEYAGDAVGIKPKPVVGNDGIYGKPSQKTLVTNGFRA